MRAKLTVVLTILALCATGAVSSAAAPPCTSAGTGGDWPVFQHDVTATGAQSAATKINASNVGKLQVAWVAPLAGGVESEPVEDGGCVFIGAQTGQVYAFDAATGALEWQQTALATATTLSVDGGRVFVQAGSIVAALDETTGAILWQHDFAPYSSIGSPLAAGGFVIIGMSGCSDFGSRPAPCRGYYALLDPTDGHVIADGYDVSDADVARGMEGPGYWSHPSYDPEDKYIYFGSANTRSIAPENPLSDALVKIDADPTRATFGKIVGYFRSTPLNQLANLPGGVQLCGETAPAYSAPLVCIDDDDVPSTAIIFRDSQGDKRLGLIHQDPTRDMPFKGTYGTAGMPLGHYYSLDPTTGATDTFGGTPMRSVWGTETHGGRAAAGAYDGSKIYYSNGSDGLVTAVDKDSGAIVWQSPVFGTNSWQHVTEANGVVFSPGGQAAALTEGEPGFLFAFDARDGAPLLQRPLTPDVGAPATGTISGGVTIARDTVFVPTNLANPGGLANAGGSGFLIAYRLPA